MIFKKIKHNITKLINKLSDEELLGAYREHYANDYHTFFTRAFSELHNGKDIIDNWHLEYICRRLQQETQRISRGEPRKKHLIINIPPRSAKSLLTSVVWPAYSWLIDPSLKFISISYSSILSTTHSRLTRKVIESSWYKMFSDVTMSKDQTAKGQFEIVGGGGKFSTSVGGSLTGEGGDIIILDDILKPSEAMSVTERTNANTFYAETVASRLDDPDIGMFVIVSQRLHDNDLVGYLLENEPENWEIINIPATMTPRTSPEVKGFYKNQLFFPERFTLQTLQNLKKTLGSYAYSAQYDQEPVDLKGGMVKTDWLPIIEHTHPDIREILKQPVNFTIDSAYTKKEDNDPSGILAYYTYNNNIYIKNVFIDRLEFPELLDKSAKWCQENGADSRSRIFVENKASGISLVQMLKKATKLNAIEYKQTTQDKVSRLNDVLPQLEAHRCYLIEGQWNGEFVKQVTKFPKAKHDEEVDLLVMAMNKKASGQYSYR